VLPHTLSQFWWMQICHSNATGKLKWYTRYRNYLQKEFTKNSFSVSWYLYKKMISIITLSMVGVERSMSETTRRSSKGRKIGAWCIFNARKARPAGPSPHLGCVFVQRRRKRRMARPEGPSRCFGCGSFVEESRSSGEARRAEPTSPFLVASNQKRQILALVVSP